MLLFILLRGSLLLFLVLPQGVLLGDGLLLMLMPQGVLLEGCLLKPQMIIAGADYQGTKPGPDEVAERTLRVMRRCVPAAVPGIMFLSGGQVGAAGRGGACCGGAEVMLAPA